MSENKTLKKRRHDRIYKAKREASEGSRIVDQELRELDDVAEDPRFNSKAMAAIERCLELDVSTQVGPWKCEYDRVQMKDWISRPSEFGTPDTAIRVASSHNGTTGELIAEYRSSAPRLAKALKIAIEVLEQRQFVTHNGEDFNDDKVQGALEDIEAIFEGEK